MRRGGTLLLLTTAIALVLVGCAPSAPDRAGWDEQATKALEDVAGQVATAHLVLREERDDDLLGRSATTMLVDAEDAAGTTTDDLSAAQPPSGRRKAHTEVTDLLDKACGLITDARIAVVAGNRTAYAGLLRDLDRMEQRLTERAEAGP